MGAHPNVVLPAEVHAELLQERDEAFERIDRDGREIRRLLAENEKLRTTLEIIAEGATDKLKALQARTVLDNIGPSTGEQDVSK